MTDKPDTNLPGKKPEAGGVEGVGTYTTTRPRTARVSGFTDPAAQDDEHPLDQRRGEQDGGGEAVRLDPHAVARMNAFY
jgi:hypothetical protein